MRVPVLLSLLLLLPLLLPLLLQAHGRLVGGLCVRQLQGSTVTEKQLALELSLLVGWANLKSYWPRFECPCVRGAHCVHAGGANTRVCGMQTSRLMCRWCVRREVQAVCRRMLRSCLCPWHPSLQPVHPTRVFVYCSHHRVSLPLLLSPTLIDADGVGSESRGCCWPGGAL